MILLFSNSRPINCPSALYNIIIQITTPVLTLFVPFQNDDKHVPSTLPNRFQLYLRGVYS